MNREVHSTLEAALHRFYEVLPDVNRDHLLAIQKLARDVSGAATGVEHSVADVCAGLVADPALGQQLGADSAPHVTTKLATVNCSTAMPMSAYRIVVMLMIVRRSALRPSHMSDRKRRKPCSNSGTCSC